MSVPGFVKILEVKRYSKNTIDSYVSIVKMTRHFFDKPLDKVDETELHRYFYFMVHTKKVSYSYQKQIAMALKLYYKEMFGQNLQNLTFNQQPYFALVHTFMSRAPNFVRVGET